MINEKKKNDLEEFGLKQSFLNYQYNEEDKKIIKETLQEEAKELQKVDFSKLNEVNFETRMNTQDDIDFLNF